MQLPENIRGYRISGDLVRTLNEKTEFYTIAMNPRQAIDRFFSSNATLLETNYGEAKLEAISLTEIPKNILEDLVSKYYPEKVKSD